MEIPITEVTLKEEGLIQLFRADSRRFGRGFSDGAKSSVPHEVPMTEGIFAMAQHTIDYAREHFPDVEEIRGKDYELGVVIGVWASMKSLEFAVSQNPRLREKIEELGGIPS
ncbi:hypothetical protein KBD20_02160 [Candidatus Saccharibacteria bacterium]|nr:hypothetical protein [Candidatus Saccharibacteria bacterium]